MGIFKLALRTQVQRFWLWEPPQVMDLRVLMFEYVFSLSVLSALELYEFVYERDPRGVRRRVARTCRLSWERGSQA